MGSASLANLPRMNCLANLGDSACSGESETSACSGESETLHEHSFDFSQELELPALLEDTGKGQQQQMRHNTFVED